MLSPSIVVIFVVGYDVGQDGYDVTYTENFTMVCVHMHSIFMFGIFFTEHYGTSWAFTVEVSQSLCQVDLFDILYSIYTRYMYEDLYIHLPYSNQRRFDIRENHEERCLAPLTVNN